ncbi:MAG: formate transporter FocA [Methylotetracoccus sp.]
MSHNTIDNLMPKDVALRAENAGVVKANLDVQSTLLLSVLAGAFISFGAVFSTTVLSGNGFDGAIKLPFGVMRLIGGSVFCLGLVLVIIAGAEMFTGNVLLVMAAASRKIGAGRVLRNWGIVFIGNLIGATLSAYLIFLTGQYGLTKGQVGLTALNIAELKTALTFGEAVSRAMFCNILVCLAIWLSLSGRSVIDKVAVIVFPITAFVTVGFEHSVANMYFLSIGLFIKQGASAEFWNVLGTTPDAFPHINLFNAVFRNLLPVTLGNTLGGVIIGLMYWGIYCRPSLVTSSDDQDLIRRLIQQGGHQEHRMEITGQVAVEFHNRTFRGRLRHLGEKNLVAEFYASQGMPIAGERIAVNIANGDGSLQVQEVQGQIAASRPTRNLMGRELVLLSINIIEIRDADRRNLSRILAAKP